MLGDPRSGSNVCEPPDRQIGKSGEDRGQIVLGKPRKSFVGHPDAIFVFAMSAEWFDNGLIVRHLANEETSAQGSQPYGKAGSGVGPRRPAPASFLPGAFRALRRRFRGRSRQTSRTSGCAD